MSTRYLEAITEVTNWLATKQLDENIYILLDNGYDDLDAISQATDSELEEIEKLFPWAEGQKTIRSLAVALRRVGIASYRTPNGMREFQRLIAIPDVTIDTCRTENRPKVIENAVPEAGQSSSFTALVANDVAAPVRATSNSVSLRESLAVATALSPAEQGQKSHSGSVVAPAVTQSVVTTTPRPSAGSISAPATVAVGTKQEERRPSNSVPPTIIVTPPPQSESHIDNIATAATAARKSTSSDVQPQARKSVGGPGSDTKAQDATVPITTLADRPGAPGRSSMIGGGSLPSGGSGAGSNSNNNAANNGNPNGTSSSSGPGNAASNAGGTRSGSESAAVIKSGYLCVRHSKTEKTDVWTDKFVLLEGSNLRFLTTRKENQTEQLYALSKTLLNVRPSDDLTIRLNFSTDHWLDLWSVSKDDITDWLKEIDKFKSEESKSRGSFLASAKPAVTKVCSAKTCNLPVSKPPYCADHQPGGAAEQKAKSTSPKPGTTTLSDRKDNRPPPPAGNLIPEVAGAVYKPPGTITGDDSDEDSDDDKAGTPGTPGPGKSSSFAGLVPVKDEAAWEAAIKAQAAEFARMCVCSATTANYDTPQEVKQKLTVTPKDSEMEKRVKTFLLGLINGSVFKKYKRGNASRRLIWVTPLLDHLCWGDEQKTVVKGYLQTKDIEEIMQGFGKNITKVYVVTQRRTLELETKDAQSAKEWIEAFEFLIQMMKAYEASKKEMVSKPEHQKKLAELKVESTKIVQEGDVFKKWPEGRKDEDKTSLMNRFRRGPGYTVRKVFAEKDMSALNWSDNTTNKVKGFIAMGDIVYVDEVDDKEKMRFTIFSKGRALDLEAKSKEAREKFVKAIRFFIEYHKTSPPPRPKEGPSKGKDKGGDE